MSQLPELKGKDLVEFLEFLDFKVVRTRGSHIRLKAEDGRVMTVPVHPNKSIPRGLLRKIIREYLKIGLDEFLCLYSKYKGI